MIAIGGNQIKVDYYDQLLLLLRERAAYYRRNVESTSGGGKKQDVLPAGTPWYCWSGPIGTAHEKGSFWVLGQIASLDWYKIIWPYKLHQFARFGRQLAAIPFM
jgi:hypothetical protein